MDGNRLKAEIVRRGLTQKEVFEAIEMPVSSWYACVNGACEFKLSDIKGIADFLKLDAKEIMEIFFAK